ncbi:MAG TPA: hypothetical protein VLH94_01730 [Spirochaetia bacterium]|nr:hypothetical protein [Spirochaetia bacterium]
MSQSNTIVIALVLVFFLAILSSVTATCLLLFVGVDIVWLFGLLVAMSVVIAAAIENKSYYRESFIAFLVFSVINIIAAILGTCFGMVALTLILVTI